MILQTKASWLLGRIARDVLPPISMLENGRVDAGKYVLDTIETV